MTILITIIRMLRQWKQCLGIFMNQCFPYLPSLNCLGNIGIVSFTCVNSKNGMLRRFSSIYCSVIAYNYRAYWYKPFFFSVSSGEKVKIMRKNFNRLKLEVCRIWIFQVLLKSLRFHLRALTCFKEKIDLFFKVIQESRLSFNVKNY